jgi:cytochrome c-type biogenesis protein CcmH
MCLVALAFILLPSWQQKRRNGRWSKGQLFACAAVAPIATVLYFHVTTWDEAKAEQASQTSRLVAELAERMHQNPDDVRGWRLLGNAYMALGQHVQARAAFAEAWQRTPLPDNALKVEFAEAQVFAEQNALTGPASRLFDEVLETDPTNIKALWYSGLSASQLGYAEVARLRWTSLLEHQLPGDVRRTVQQALAALGPPNDTTTIPATGRSITVNVRVDDRFNTAVLTGAARLFVFARTPSEPAPVAVGQWPVSALPGAFNLSDANSMTGHSLGNYDSLRVVARVSLTGDAREHSGDWQGEATLGEVTSNSVDVLIDRVID